MWTRGTAVKELSIKSNNLMNLTWNVWIFYRMLLFSVKIWIRLLIQSLLEVELHLFSSFFTSLVLRPPRRKTSWMTSPSSWARCKVSRWGVTPSSTLVNWIQPSDRVTVHCVKISFSSKVVAKKRRDRGLPRAFEIFTDSKTYVLKAQDEKHAEEWLQCINVAVAQARERENREATTYLWEQHC